MRTVRNVFCSRVSWVRLVFVFDQRACPCRTLCLCRFAWLCIVRFDDTRPPVAPDRCATGSAEHWTLLVCVSRWRIPAAQLRCTCGGSVITIKGSLRSAARAATLDLSGWTPAMLPVPCLSASLTADLQRPHPCGVRPRGPRSAPLPGNPKTPARHPSFFAFASLRQKTQGPGRLGCVVSLLAGFAGVFWGCPGALLPGGGSASLHPTNLPDAGASSERWGAQRLAAPASAPGVAGLRLDASPHCDESQWTLLRD